MEIQYASTTSSAVHGLVYYSKFHHLPPINTQDSSICSGKSCHQFPEVEERSESGLISAVVAVLSACASSAGPWINHLCYSYGHPRGEFRPESKPTVLKRLIWSGPVAGAHWPHLSPTQLSHIHNVLWCKPIDLCFFWDLFLDQLQAAQFPSSPHLPSVSHKSMWCNCINSHSHRLSLEEEYSQRERERESVSLWPVNLNPLIPTTGWLVKFLFEALNIYLCSFSLWRYVGCLIFLKQQICGS